MTHADMVLWETRVNGTYIVTCRQPSAQPLLWCHNLEQRCDLALCSMATSFTKIAVACSPALHRLCQSHKCAFSQRHILTVRDRLHNQSHVLVSAVSTSDDAAGRPQGVTLAGIDISKLLSRSTCVLLQRHSETPASSTCRSTAVQCLSTNGWQVHSSAAQAATVLFICMRSQHTLVSNPCLKIGAAAGWYSWMHLRCCFVLTLDSKLCALQPLRGRTPPFCLLFCDPCWAYWS